jgi:large subunit ribosomal protein L3
MHPCEQGDAMEKKMTEENSNTEAAAEKSAPSTSVELSSFYGRKAGMTRIFNEDGNHVAVTVIELLPNFITQVKTKAKDGYEAYQVGYYGKREKLINKPTKGRLAKAGVKENLARYAEILTAGTDVANLGKELSVDGFTPGTYIDVTGKSKGKGFQGVMKRWNMAGGPGAHGTGFRRTGGSIGMCASPGRVMKGKHMAGHMGDKRETVQNLKIVEVNKEKGYLLIKGSVPGSKSGFVRISKAIKK